MNFADNVQNLHYFWNQDRKQTSMQKLGFLILFKSYTVFVCMCFCVYVCVLTLPR